MVTATYFHDAPAVRLDLDNAVKPLLDALAGLIYIDDKQVTHARLGKVNLDGDFQVRGMSPVLADAFVAGVEFVYVRVEEAPDPRFLP